MSEFDVLEQMSNVENGQLLKASLTFVTHFEKLLNSDLSVSPAETKQKIQRFAVVIFIGLPIL